MSKHKFFPATVKLLLTAATVATLAACNQQTNIKESSSADTRHVKPTEVSLGSFAPAAITNNVLFELPNWGGGCHAVENHPA